MAATSMVPEVGSLKGVVKLCSYCSTYYSYVLTLLLKDVWFSHNTQCHRQMNGQTDRRTDRQTDKSIPIADRTG